MRKNSSSSNNRRTGRGGAGANGDYDLPLKTMGRMSQKQPRKHPVGF